MNHTGFQFNGRDAEILDYVYRLRVATLDHLSALTNRSKKTLERRVPKLRKEHYLKCLRPRPHKGLYVIGPESLPVLIEGGYAAHDVGGKRRREQEWRDLTIPHALLVASIQTRLLVLTRGSQVKLVHWEHDHRGLWDSVQTAHDGFLPVRPDAYLILQRDGTAQKDRLHFFLEADVGTMAHARIALKLAAYAAYHAQQRHVAKFGISSFRVPVITQTRARAEYLAAELHQTMSVAQRRAYPFIALEDLTLESLAL